MPDHFREGHPARRKGRRLQLSHHDHGLEPRLLLSTGPTPPGIHSTAQVASALAQSAHRSVRSSHRTQQHPQRVTPTAEVNAQFATFLADFALVESAHVESIVNGQTSTTTVNATVTAPYTAPAATIQVDNAAVFGANGIFATPVNASASLGGIPLGASYLLTGRNGNTLIVNTALSSSTNLPIGATLSASVQSTSQTSAATIFPSYITTRTQLMAINLVNYFNSLPLKLPYFNAPPHTANQRVAIQNYVYNQIAGNGMTAPSLQQSLLAITLPTTAGPDLTIYNAAVVSAVEQSRQQVLGGISQIYAGHLKISAPAPANRLGIFASGSTGTSSGTSGASGTGGTSSGTSGTSSGGSTSMG
jgi:hypothetical protein